MKIETFKNGELLENCYLIYDERDALIIDPGNIIKDLDNYIQEHSLNVLGILITHYHDDHIVGLEYYVNLYNVNVFNYKNNTYNKIGCFNFEIIKTFGHTLNSVCFYFEEFNIMFTGDTLFKDTIGNYKECDKKIMYNSLRKIIEYDKNIIIYPGHDSCSTIGDEIKMNVFLKELL